MVQSVQAFSAVVAVIAVSLSHPVLAQEPDQHPGIPHYLPAGAGRGAGAETSRGFPWVPGELAACRPSADGCKCTFASLETIQTFGEAAENVLLYYKHAQAADEYPLLMSHLLRECLGQVVAPIVFPFVDIKAYYRGLEGRGPMAVSRHRTDPESR